MRLLILTLAVITLAAPAAHPQQTPANASPSVQGQARGYVGLDRNDYPGDGALADLHKHFAFIGYWLNNPPGTDHNNWAGKREILLGHGFGFLIVYNGRLDKEIKRAKKHGASPAALGRKDGLAAVAAARREGFPAGAILFLDQEEGGRMLPEQAGYLLSWTQTVAKSAYRPGVYASGQPVDDGKGPNGRPVTITTIQDIREHVAAEHLHTIAFWVAQDACPPAPGCVVQPPPPEASGTPDATAWQYAQTPRRKAITEACAETYNRDGSCYTPGPARFDVDLSVSASADPSHGR